MTPQARKYQSDAVEETINYLSNNPGKAPVIVLPTGSGKSVVNGMLCSEIHERFSAFKPRGIITVPSKELCEQNTEKLVNMMPPGISVDMYSASAGRKNANADIVVCTIGTVAKYPEELSWRSYWLNDECHLAKPDGTGDYWKFHDNWVSMNNLHRKNRFHAGYTATPFRGNGVWITDGKKPMYHGISHKTGMDELLKLGFLSPLVNPQSKVTTRVDTSGIKISGDDFNLHDLVERTKDYLVSAAHEAKIIAAERKKWMAFLPDVSSSVDFCKILNSIGISAAIVTGDTPSKDREYLIANFKAGNIRCLITVIALTTGFDVPDIDCILWLRSTHSPVLYVQGAGRGTRIAPGKINCLWIDFTDTTERLGAIDKITGRPAKRNQKRDAPCIICPNCGEMWAPASKEVCAEYLLGENKKPILDKAGNRIRVAGCGEIMRTPDDLDPRYASDAAIMACTDPHPEYPVNMITVNTRKTQYGKDFIRIEFFSGMTSVCRRDIFFSGIGMNQESAEWWKLITGDWKLMYNNFTSCLQYINQQLVFNKSLGIKYVKLDRNKNAKYPPLLEIMR